MPGERRWSLTSLPIQERFSNGQKSWADPDRKTIKAKEGIMNRKKSVSSYPGKLFVFQTVETAKHAIGASPAVRGLRKLPAAHQKLYQRAGTDRCLSHEAGHAHLKSRPERFKF